MLTLHQIAYAGQGAWPITWLMTEATDEDLAAILYLLEEMKNRG